MSFLPVSVRYAHLDAEILFHKPYGLVVYYPQVNVLYSEVMGRFTHAEFRHLYTELLRIIKAKLPCGLIASQRRSNGSTIQDRAWLVTAWLSQLKEVVGENFVIAGLKETQQAGFKRFIAEYLERTVPALVPFQVQAFPDFDAGMDFILRTKTNLPT